ncbi:Uncharacterised protein [Mycobacteroides abscessus subsp. massiliense]|nr:Uncharacterised protein [Mycobacteroides abscessus subsp. massiliense]SKJ90454.1 Uncharacterised protein [Mycobacteroides abscessus subsp. massiliense]SKK21220.1 Uncharacterised protein [Mycobacteroides abscessus subsp. massiliense]SKK74705.1 Uncharacterised protein [Mycobacteroides abscessus subsp. massiliense]SKK78642.1 Uncharacterised protein [Mycobacteroides abscessus subsp. massiliense]
MRGPRRCRAVVGPLLAPETLAPETARIIARWFGAVFGVITALLATGAQCAVPFASADPVNDRPVAYPGMAIVRGQRQCTLSYVDPLSYTGMTAGECTDTGSVTDVHGNLLGEVLLMSRNLQQNEGDGPPPDDIVSDYAAIKFDSRVQLSNTMPDGTRLRLAQTAGVEPGLATCLTGSASGQLCGKVEAVDKDWFTIADVTGRMGDSGAPVYTVTQPGEALLVGIYSLRWGSPSAMSWSAISSQISTQLVPQIPAAGPGNGGPDLPVTPTGTEGI